MGKVSKSIIRATDTGGLDLVRLRAGLEFLVAKLPIHDIDHEDAISLMLGERWEVIIDKMFADVWNTIAAKNAWSSLADYLELIAQIIRYAQGQTDLPPEMDDDEVAEFERRVRNLRVEYEHEMEVERRILEREGRG